MAENENQAALDPAKLVRFYRVFGRHYLQHIGLLTVAFTSLLLGIGVSLALPWTLALLLDIVANQPIPTVVASHAPWLLGDPMVAAAVLLTAYVVIKILISLFTFLDKYYVSVVGETMVKDIRERVFAHLQRLSLSFHNAAESGDVIFRMTKDVKDIKKLLVNIPQDLVQRILTIGSYGGILLVLNWKLALLAFTVIPTISRYTGKTGLGVHKAEKKKKKKEGKVATIVSENLRNMPLVQAFGRESSERAEFVKQNQSSLTADLTAIRLFARFKRLMDMLVAVATASILYVGGRAVLDGGVTLGTFYIFYKYTEDLYGPIDKLTEAIVSLAKHQVAGERTLELVESDMVIHDTSAAVAVPEIQGRIEFDDVSFAYKKTSGPVLEHVGFTAESGETVALVGHSGAGKSTLISLLLRFYDPTEGAVTIDGRDLRKFTLRSLRSHVTILLQDTLLMHKTIRENIAFGRPSATDEEIVAAASKAEAHGFIAKLADGYDTIVSEDGRNLSGGQRQRLSIARAILRDAPILILDEPTSGLDAQTEANLTVAIDRLQQGRTTFIIAHQLRTIRNADKILFLEEGNVVDQGTHDELFARSPQYRELYELQQGGTAA
ncbi:MAG: ABC transporter ATP-binding protein [Myxococcales bacterium]|nr:ABC transporter ATP-binding protein [Myxococcales bacterium]